MSPTRFASMVLTMTAMLFALMYIGAYSTEHLYFSETRFFTSLLMGAAITVILVAFAGSPFRSRTATLGLLLATGVVGLGALWLVRSQYTVSGPSYLRAMIPHQSVAILTSERAGIRDARVRRLADGIIAAQGREIAEMAFLIAHVSEGEVLDSAYRDPPAQVGTLQDALSSVRLASLDLESLTVAEARRAGVVAARCVFRQSRTGDPVLWIGEDGAAAARLNGTILALAPSGGMSFGAQGITMSLDILPVDHADWRGNAELVFRLRAGHMVGYRGHSDCEAQPDAGRGSG